jgi:hypothetical protein
MKGDLKSAGTDSDKAAHPFPSGRTLTMQPEEKSELSMTSTKTAYMGNQLLVTGWVAKQPWEAFLFLLRLQISYEGETSVALINRGKRFGRRWQEILIFLCLSMHPILLKFRKETAHL